MSKFLEIFSTFGENGETEIAMVALVIAVLIVVWLKRQEVLKKRTEETRRNDEAIALSYGGEAYTPHVDFHKK